MNESELNNRIKEVLMLFAGEPVERCDSRLYESAKHNSYGKLRLYYAAKEYLPEEAYDILDRKIGLDDYRKQGLIKVAKSTGLSLDYLFESVQNSLGKLRQIKLEKNKRVERRKYFEHCLMPENLAHYREQFGDEFESYITAKAEALSRKYQAEDIAADITDLFEDALEFVAHHVHDNMRLSDTGIGYGVFYLPDKEDMSKEKEITTLGELKPYTADDILNARNFGPIILQKIQTTLEKYGMKLKD